MAWIVGVEKVFSYASKTGYPHPDLGSGGDLEPGIIYLDEYGDLNSGGPEDGNVMVALGAFH
jgi:hypothetical protein